MAEIAAISAFLAANSTALATAGTLVSAAGAVAGGLAEKSRQDQLALQEEEQGKEEFAASQREAMARRREGALVSSRQQALAAASGAGAGEDAPTIVRLMRGTAEQTEFGAQSELFGGKSRRAGLRRSAQNRRASGNASLLGSVFKAAGTGLGAFG